MNEVPVDNVAGTREKFPLWDVIYWIALGVTIDCAFLLIRDSPPICDEGLHLEQIVWFLKGNFHQTQGIPMLPVYHGIIASIYWFTGGKTLAQLRLVSFVIAIFNVWVFHVIVKRLWPAEAYLRTVQFAFFPILFPFFFLIYTDALSLLFVLLAVERSLMRKALISALLISAATLIRQTNIFWAIYLWLVLIQQEQLVGGSVRQTMMALIRKTWPFLLLFAAFGACILSNGIVANGQATHQYPTIDLANGWFFGILFAFLFLPNTVAALLDLCKEAPTKHPVAIVGVVSAIILFWGTYHISHQYNQPGLWFYLRNRLLYCTTHYTAVKVMAGFVALVGLWAFMRAPLAERKFGILPHAAILSVIFLPIIEQRYYLVPMSLFLALRKAGPKTREILQTIAYLVVTGVLFIGISRGWFFL